MFDLLPSDLNSVFDTFSDPQKLHSLMVHLPIAIAAIGLVLVLGVLITGSKSPGLRWTTVFIYLIGTLASLWAVDVGDQAIDALDKSKRLPSTYILSQHKEASGEHGQQGSNGPSADDKTADANSEDEKNADASGKAKTSDKAASTPDATSTDEPPDTTPIKETAKAVSSSSDVDESDPGVIMHRHEELGRYLWVGLALAAVLVMISGIRVTWWKSLTLILALIVAAGNVAWVGVVAHYGGQMVFEHQIGVPSPKSQGQLSTPITDGNKDKSDAGDKDSKAADKVSDKPADKATEKTQPKKDKDPGERDLPKASDKDKNIFD